MRPLTDAEWTALMREHDVVDEARKLIQGSGEINSLRGLERAVKRYDDARRAVSVSASKGAGWTL